MEQLDQAQHDTDIVHAWFVGDVHLAPITLSLFARDVPEIAEHQFDTRPPLGASTDLRHDPSSFSHNTHSQPCMLTLSPVRASMCM